MKPHPRIRKTINWGGLALSVLLAAAWLWSGRWCLLWSDELEWAVALERGCVVVYGPYRYFSGVPYDGWYVLRQPFGFHWKTGLVDNGVRPAWHIRLYWTATLAVVSMAIAWRLDILARRRARADRCPKCAYDRTGLAPAAVCPECGANSQ